MKSVFLTVALLGVSAFLTSYQVLYIDFYLVSAIGVVFALIVYGSWFIGKLYGMKVNNDRIYREALDAKKEMYEWKMQTAEAETKYQRESALLMEARNKVTNLEWRLQTEKDARVKADDDYVKLLQAYADLEASINDSIKIKEEAAFKRGRLDVLQVLRETPFIDKHVDLTSLEERAA